MWLLVLGYWFSALDNANQRPTSFFAKNQQPRTNNLLAALARLAVAAFACMPTMLAPTAHGLEPLVLDPAQGRYALTRQLEFFEDATKTYGIEDVSSPERAPKFTPAPDTELNFGISTSAYWIRFQLKNDSPVPQARLLELD